VLEDSISTNTAALQCVHTLGLLATFAGELEACASSGAGSSVDAATPVVEAQEHVWSACIQLCAREPFYWRCKSDIAPFQQLLCCYAVVISWVATGFSRGSLKTHTPSIVVPDVRLCLCLRCPLDAASTATGTYCRDCAKHAQQSPWRSCPSWGACTCTCTFPSCRPQWHARPPTSVCKEACIHTCGSSPSSASSAVSAPAVHAHTLSAHLQLHIWTPKFQGCEGWHEHSTQARLVHW
jgi:hypothetical protein